MGPDGVLGAARRGLARRGGRRRARRPEVEAVAVCLLFSYLHPEHERRVGEALRAALPGVRVSLSSELLPEFREYERSSTTVANAYLAPRARRPTSRATRAAEPLVMQSSGGVVDAADCGGAPGRCVLSGPAAGVAGAAFVAGLSGYARRAHVRHGRHEHGRRRRARRRGAGDGRVGRRRRADPLPDGRRAHDRRGRRLDRLARRRRRAARRAALGRRRRRARPATAAAARSRR